MEANKDALLKLKEVVFNSRCLVFFGGAGVSTESGVPDFRSTDGLYNQKYAYPPETILSHTFFMSRTKEFYDFYREKMLYLNAEPNKAHLALKKLEDMGILKAIITQNIDGLHQKAGSRVVYELHGSVYRNRCMRCKKAYAVEDIKNSRDVPKCACGGIIKPDVVLYEEALDEDVLYKASAAVSVADTMIVAGTSLTVYPAAGFVNLFTGENLVLINLQPTPCDKIANIIIRDKVGKVLSGLFDE